MKLRCTECRKAFRWEPLNGWPRHCPECGVYIGIDGKDEVVLPFIRTNVSKSGDQVYRQMEEASERRAEKAAEMAGVPVSEMSGLKITDLNSTRHEGDIAAVEDKAAMANLGVKDSASLFKPNGAEYAAGISTGAVTVNGQTVQGVSPRAGMTAQAKIQRAFGR